MRDICQPPRHLHWDSLADHCRSKSCEYICTSCRHIDSNRLGMVDCGKWTRARHFDQRSQSPHRNNRPRRCSDPSCIEIWCSDKSGWRSLVRPRLASRRNRSYHRTLGCLECISCCSDIGIVRAGSRQGSLFHHCYPDNRQLLLIYIKQIQSFLIF